MEPEMRQLAEQAYEKRSYQSAAFFADKLLTLAPEDLHTLYLLASCYFHLAEYPRVFYLLEKHKVLNRTHKFQVLAGQALLASKDYQKCIRVLTEPAACAENSGQWQALKAFYLGKAYEASESKQLAAQHYSEALRQDPTCIEAFSALLDNQLLTAEDEIVLFQSLTPIPQWLSEYYFTRLKSTPLELQKSVLVEKNSDYLLAVGNRLLFTHKVEQAYEISNRIIREDPYHLGAVPLHCGCMAALGEIGELYHLAHHLVKDYSESAAAWYAAGVYYYLIKKYEFARKFFIKAYKIDKDFIHAWVAYGHTYAAQDQSDQAMSAYRTVARLFPGCHLANLYMGMEYLRTKNLRTALLSFELAKKVNANDPIVWNEIGVVLYKKQEYSKANAMFQEALRLSEGVVHSTSGTIIFNLAHTYRKLHQFGDAIGYYNKCIQMNSRCASTYSALGLTYYLNFQVQEAVDCFNKALFLKSNDRFTNDLLYIALFEYSETMSLDEVMEF